MRTSVSEQQTKKQVQVDEERKEMEKLEHRAVIKFLTIEGLTPNQIKERIDNVHGDSAPSYSMIKNWSKLFRCGRGSIEDDPRSSRPVSEVTLESVKLVEQMVLSDRRLKTKEIATLSKTTVLRILHDYLGMSKISRGVRLLHDKAPVHVVALTKAIVRKLRFTEINHPPYNPNLAPSDYFLFSKLKADLRGGKFGTDEEVKEVVNEHFRNKTSEYLYSGIDAIIQRCKKCIEIKGDYIEK
nr:uncharacterized protein LOC116424357 [Nomia melanderi]